MLVRFQSGGVRHAASQAGPQTVGVLTISRFFLDISISRNIGKPIMLLNSQTLDLVFKGLQGRLTTDIYTGLRSSRKIVMKI